MDSKQEMRYEGLSRFGIYKKPSILEDFSSHRSKSHKLCFVSFIAVLFILSVTITLLDYTNANVSPNTTAAAKFDRIYSNHRLNISNTEYNEYVSVNNSLNAKKTENVESKETPKPLKTNAERVNIEFMVSKAKSNNMHDLPIGDNSTRMRAYPIIRREYYRPPHVEFIPTSRKQRIMNSPFFDPSFTADNTFFNPFQAHPPAYYGHSPLNVFTENYAQLRPYRDSNHVKSVNDVIQYIDPSLVYITTAMPEVAQTKKKMIKFTGTYVRPLDDESGEGSEEIQTGVLPQNEPARPFVKGQNFTDPFKKFRPFNPLEINRLQPIMGMKGQPNMGAKLEPRDKKEVFPSYLPTPPFMMKPPCPLDPAEVQVPNTSAGTKTVAIFHPPDPGNMDSSGEQRQYRKRRKRPFSLMLDIYPVQNGAGPVSAATNTKYATIPHHLWGPHRFPPAGDLQQQASNALLNPDNRMVVHLNLYPTRYGKSSKYRRDRSNKEELMTVLSGGTFSKKHSDSNVDLIMAENRLREELQENEMSEKEEINRLENV